MAIQYKIAILLALIGVGMMLNLVVGGGIIGVLIVSAMWTLIFMRLLSHRRKD